METEPPPFLNEPISQKQKDHFRPDAGKEPFRLATTWSPPVIPCRRF